MGNSPTFSRRFRSNPVEILIFGAVCALAGYSLLKTLSAPPVAHHAGFANGFERFPAARTLASLREQAGSLEIPCELSETSVSNAPTVKLFGAACDVPHGAPTHLLRTRIVNEANQFTSTVELKTPGLLFESGEIPLQAGKNRLVLEYTYSDGTQVARSFVIDRAP